MKILIWSLVLSMSLGLWSPPFASRYVEAQATETVTVGNQTGTTTPTIVQPPPTQNQAQQNTERENEQGSNQSSMLGMMAIAAGTAMMAAGAAMMANPPTAAAGAALMAAGAAMLAAGMMGMAAAGQMANNAGKAGYNSGTMSNISQTPVSGVGKTNPGIIKIDPSLMRDPKAAQIFDDLKNKTGLSAEDLAAGLNDGKSIGEMLAKKTGVSAEKIDGMIANATPMSGAEAMSKLGLTPEELAAMAKNGSLGDDANSYAQAGGGDRKTASANSFDGMFAKNDTTGASVAGGVGLDGKLSPEVQAALDKEGITSRTIFDMVSTQYKRKTPMMFGVQQKAMPTGDKNPFADLKGNGIDI